ncbi:AAA family ATPase [Streptomyces solicathayae]|uniref:AAA family ATPase n=1 Tax=Streptomyces solicathayae TaxID=3081768 RepID=A0ABZ0LRF9_9ACTN|nr:AAA family ATPase [Streptomyces sp. HUAS YS2]WOX22075.1 AAA family ATPase [Streptomyces sp. HUAS YS2]
MSGSSVSWHAARKCERLWVEGMMLLRQGRDAEAAGRFQQAVEQDPTAADAWLGLHATGRRQAEALAAMSLHHRSFGVLRNKNTMQLQSRFDLGHYATFRLESARDLWLAGLVSMLDDKRFDEVEPVLMSAHRDCDETRFLYCRFAFLKKDWPRVLEWSRDISDGFQNDEARLYVAYALVHDHMFHEVLNTLSGLPRSMRKGARFEGEVSYLRGLAHEGLGRPDEALRHFQFSYRCFPTFGDVAERAKQRTAPPAPPSAPPPAPPSTPPAAPAQPARPTRSATPAGSAAPTTPDPAAAPADDGGREAQLAEAMAMLDGMVGLDSVKRQLRTMIAQLRMAVVRREQGLPSTAGPQHFVFAGPPGTGKTTVARIVGKVFAGLGLLESGHVVETQRVDLVGQYLGATAIKTTAVIDSALGGVLFIDEAYALHNTGYSGGDAFGKEALQVLLKRAEDDRERLVVILAGYPDEMSQLLSTNPGLASRFTTRVDFPSYSTSELEQIARGILDGQGDTLDDDSATALGACFRRAAEDGLVERLGNGRFARELCRKAAALRDLRVYEVHGGSGMPSREELTASGSRT